MTLVLAFEPDWDPLHGVEKRVVEYFGAYLAVEGLAALAAKFEEKLDEVAGEWALTAAEKHERVLCRRHFGLYDPSKGEQRRYLNTVLAEEKRLTDGEGEGDDLDDLITGMEKIMGDRICP